MDLIKRWSTNQYGPLFSDDPSCGSFAFGQIEDESKKLKILFFFAGYQSLGCENTRVETTVVMGLWKSQKIRRFQGHSAKSFVVCPILYIQYDLYIYIYIYVYDKTTHGWFFGLNYRTSQPWFNHLLPGTEGWSEEKLQEIISRDALIGACRGRRVVGWLIQESATMLQILGDYRALEYRGYIGLVGGSMKI